MEDNYGWILMIVATVISAITAANKADKKKKEAERRMPPVSPSGFGGKYDHGAGSGSGSGSGSNNDYGHAVEPEGTSFDYYSLETEYNAEEMVAGVPIVKTARAARVKTDAKVSKVSVTDEETGEEAGSHLRGILGEEFDLRRAVIESEILAPKFDKY